MERDVKGGPRPVDAGCMEQNPPSIAQRHLRWILLGGLGLGILTGLLVAALVWNTGRSGLAAILAGILTSGAASYGWGFLISRIAVRKFVTSFRTATLRLEPSTPAPQTEEQAAWLHTNGFDFHGSWMTVGNDDVVYGGVGSRLFHRNDHAITAHVDATQCAFSTALADGRTLVTTNMGALPHPALIVQGERGADLELLYDLHSDALRQFHRDGISAVQPAGGPLETRLLSDVREQEHLNTISVKEGARLVMTSASLPLQPLD